MKRKMRSLGQLLTCPWQNDIAECFFLTSIFFFLREVTAVWLLPLDSVAICYPTAKSGWSQWVKNGFCDLAFTFCPSAAGLHHQKQTLVGPHSPALEATWQIHIEAIWMYIYFWIPCGPPSIMNRFWSNRSWSSDHLTGELIAWAIRSSAECIVRICWY